MYELWITLWNRKWLVIAVTVEAALGSVVYALQQQHVYKAEALLLPPKAKDIQSMNVLVIQNTVEVDSNITGISTNAVYIKFKQNLNSRTLLKKFIQENGLMEVMAPMRTPETRDEDIYNGFAELIKLENVEGLTSLSIELNNSEIAAHWVNDLIEFVDKETIHQLVQNQRISIANQIRNIEYAIGSKRQMAKQRREDKILSYKEDSIIAMQLDIADRIDTKNVVQNNRLNITTTNFPLYYKG